VDGTFKAFAVSLPETSELVDRIPEADPAALYQVDSVFFWLRVHVFWWCMSLWVCWCVFGGERGARGSPLLIGQGSPYRRFLPGPTRSACSPAPKLRQVREFVTRELALQLRPELEAAVKENDSGGLPPLPVHACMTSPMMAGVWVPPNSVHP
jgi:hypothetical protein